MGGAQAEGKSLKKLKHKLNKKLNKCQNSDHNIFNVSVEAEKIAVVLFSIKAQNEMVQVLYFVYRPSDQIMIYILIYTDVRC